MARRELLSSLDSSLEQALGVMCEMIRDEGLDEPVRMIVALVPAHGDGLAGLRSSRLERIGMELLDEELIGLPLIDQDVSRIGATRHQHRRIPVLPAR